MSSVPRPLLIFLLLSLCTLGVVAGAGEFAITTADTETETLDIPTETVDGSNHEELDDREYEITGVGVVAEGEQVTAEITAPTTDEYYAELRDPDGQIVDSTPSAVDGESVTFETDTPGTSPGSHALILYDNSDQVALHPVVITEYDITITDAPDSAEPNDTVDISVSIPDDATPDRVEVSLYDQETIVNATANQANGEYDATIELDDQSPGEYQLSAVAIDDDGPEFAGFSGEPLAIEQGATPISISEEQSDDDDDAATGGGGGTPSGEQPTDDPTDTQPSVQTSVNMSDDSLITGNSTTATVTVTNTGSEPLNETVSVSFGELSQNRTLSLAPNSTTTMDFSHSFEMPGEYVFSGSVGDIDTFESANVTVEEPSSTTNDSDSGNNTDTGSGDDSDPVIEPAPTNETDDSTDDSTADSVPLNPAVPVIAILLTALFSAARKQHQ